jgi:hypothetical protein
LSSAKPRYNNKGISTHAEIEVISKLSRKMIKYNKKTLTTDLYVIKIGPNEELKNSSPCRHCCIELYKNKKININKIYFSNKDGKVECHFFKEWYLNNDQYTSYGWNCLR